MTGDRVIELVSQWAVEVRAATRTRNQNIRKAYRAGHSLRAIADAAQMSVEGVRKIILKETQT